ncbi:phosphatidate cytidylyltransferase [Gluconacetobacter aggeris]|uniref:Phosphatidate cytidylyltransferase n=1 Tax=Gluconacetobacter aggeris TaxID=1286186 RepID=A0A7W4ISS9_9PROT|nr:phosphatidate cytidylyltransferase [Gluconacetobacter aggeris]MBB2168410.1 phosphatidate cytidylyltransferase [Gluconacetobacter aggeris]
MSSISTLRWTCSPGVKGDSVLDPRSEPPAIPSRGRNWKDLRARLISAAVLVPMAALCIWAGGTAYAVLVLLATAGMAVEWGRLFGLHAWSWRGALYVAWPVAAMAAALGGHWLEAFLVIGGAFVFGPALWSGQVVIGCAGLALLWLRLMTMPGAGVVLFVITCVAISDSGAYLVGRLIGGPKLAPAISPAKTWSGSLGGLASAMVAGGLVCALVSGPDAWGRGVAFGALMAVAAQIGDLAESALKRARGVKDSGAIIPGHGGLLDRFDGLLVAAPLAALLSLGAAGGGAFWYVTPAGLVSALFAAHADVVPHALDGGRTLGLG